MSTLSPQTTGLRGQSVGSTAICTVGKQGAGLTYRGDDIQELAEKSSFEDVAYLLIYGELAKPSELDAFAARLKDKRDVPPPLKEVLERIPSSAHPMDVLRTACSMLGTLEPETSFAQQDAIAERVISIFPSALVYWHHFSKTRKRISTVSEESSLAGHFLALLHGR